MAISIGVHRSGRLEREAGRNLEVMWLAGLLVPVNITDKTHLRMLEVCESTVRRDNGPAIKKVWQRISVALWRNMGSAGESQRCDRRQQVQGGLFSRDNKLQRMEIWIGAWPDEESVARYLSHLRQPADPDSCRLSLPS